MRRGRIVAGGCAAVLLLAGAPHAGEAAAPPACGLSVLTDAPHSATELAKVRSSTVPGDTYRLAVAYADGSLVAQDCSTAAKLMTVAADAHLAAAENGLGEMYAAGAGVAASDHEAAKWFRAAYNDGYPRGMFNFGRVVAAGKAYEYGKQVAVASTAFDGAGEMHAASGADWALVADIWGKAADAGDPLAAYDLGKLLESGAEGVPVDRERAKALFQTAAAAGVPGAQASLDDLLREMP